MKRIPRRAFLKTVPAAAGLALTARQSSGTEPSRKAADVRIGSVAYQPARDYPIRPTRHSEVRLTDRFWKPKVDTNAAVTIPFQVRSMTERNREFGGNVLEAAILSLETHPDRDLQTQVDARVRALKDAPARGNGP